MVVPPPTEARAATKSMMVVLNPAKWLVARVVMLWQTVQALPEWLLLPCSPEFGLLYWVVPRTWQEVHWVFTLRVPDPQTGVVWPPWQLTLEQVSVAGLKVAAPVLAL